MNNIVEIPAVTDDEILDGSMRYLPVFKELPEEFQVRPYNEWFIIASSLFYDGGKLTDYGLVIKSGVDGMQANRLIQSHLRSWKPQHEHKMAGVGYLLSQYYDKVGQNEHR